jgi:1,2-diacylglycerol 3-alpha-glucosyltransferase
LRVLMISDVYFPRVNGVSTSIRTFREDLASAGCETDLIAPAYPDPWQDDPATIRVPSRFLPCDPEDRMMRFRVAARSVRGGAGEYDLVHVHTPFIAHSVGVKISRRLRIPLVESYHTLFEEYLHHYVRNMPRAWARRFARWMSLHRCDAVNTVVAPSPAMADRLREYGVTSDIEIIPTGLNLKEFEAGDGSRFRARLGISEQVPVMLYVGRVAFEKNIECLLQAFKTVRVEVPEVVLVIAGDGPARASLESRVRDRGLSGRVRFVGYLDRRTELPDCYRAASLFVFASTTETQGLVLAEAMASEVPVLAIPAMGVKEFVCGDEGIIAAPECPQGFAQIAAGLLQAPEQLRSRGVAGRRYVERCWSSAAMALKMAALYSRLVTPKASSEK